MIGYYNSTKTNTSD